MSDKEDKEDKEYEDDNTCLSAYESRNDPANYIERFNSLNRIIDTTDPSDKIFIASIDIGKLNFAFYIEEVNLKELTRLKEYENILKVNRYNPDGTPTPIFSNLLDKVYMSGKKMLVKNFDLTEGVDKNKYFDMELCYNMVDVLNEFEDYWKNIDYFIIEMQMSFGRKTNTMALKLGQNCASYFINKYGRCNKVIVEFPAYYKTQILGAKKEEVKSRGKVKYKSINDRERKKWSVEQTFYILAVRDDFETMSEVGLMKKRDDISDTVIQCQAFKYLYFIDNVIL